ncbi:hypothetical protein HYX01_01045 [Candidatus Woesearchaeota archaeon]|nr:hypothetical protein [Candidatus Woesearchaeota archaeon]
MIEMNSGLELYLCEKESVGNFYLRELDILIATQPIGDSIRQTLKLSENDARTLSNLSRDGLFKELFKRFGITDLKSYPGLPKGPYYSVDKSVYIAIKEKDLSGK